MLIKKLCNSACFGNTGMEIDGGNKKERFGNTGMEIEGGNKKERFTLVFLIHLSSFFSVTTRSLQFSARPR
jgi:hypothetical protein